MSSHAQDVLQWLAGSESQPRTRLDAYPVLVVAKDTLAKIASGRLRLSSKELHQAQEELDRLRREAEERLKGIQQNVLPPSTL